MSWDLGLTTSFSLQIDLSWSPSLKHVFVGFSRFSCIFEVVESTNLAKESTDTVVRNMQEEEARPGEHLIMWGIQMESAGLHQWRHW